MRNQYAQSAHQQMRDAALDAAAEEVITRGWSSLQIQAIARRAGVSRQTLYTTFGSKQGIAQALILRLTERFITGIETAMASHTGLYQQWFAAMRYTLDRAAGEPLLVSVLTADGSDDFLPLLTSRGAPVLDAARVRLSRALHEARPEVDVAIADDLAEAAVRLALSHIVLPLRSTEHAAAQIARIVDATYRDTRTPQALRHD
ncbi:TetR family transcriptional regulator [Actinomycetospora sp.]|uniref:TetR family transcriptional regulator n=1 Tax=Actinomycetospora sp. TaxID=1872135 RepID=UPI002F429F11